MHKTTREDWPGLKRELQGDRGLGIRLGRRKRSWRKGRKSKAISGCGGYEWGKKDEERQELVLTG